MISKQEAIRIILNQIPGAIITYTKLTNNVWFIGAQKKNNEKYEIEIDAKTGKIIGGAGGA